MSWLTIESDPAVFSSLISDLGVKGVQVEEIFSVDEQSLSALTPNHGVVFLFKYQNATEDRSKTTGRLDFDTDVWFSSQVIQNACATQAILSILLNCSDITDLGTELESFRDFTAQFPYDLRGEAMSNSEMLRTVHNSFARAEMFHMDSEGSREEGEAPYHFIAYTIIRGALFEMDGLQSGPINHGQCTKDTFGAKLHDVLAERIARYASDEVHFNLLGLTRDRLTDGDATLSEYERSRLLEIRDVQRREVEMRRFNFAGAIVELTKALLQGHDAQALDKIISDGKTATKSRREKDLRTGRPNK